MYTLLVIFCLAVIGYLFLWAGMTAKAWYDERQAQKQEEDREAHEAAQAFVDLIQEHRDELWRVVRK